MTRPVLASGGQAPEHRPPDQRGARPERERLHHVRPAPDPAVYKYLYAVLDRLYADPGTLGFGHRMAESVFDRKHIIFLRERMGPDFEYKP